MTGTELSFEVELEWSGGGRDGAGMILTDDLEIEYSAPASMGGRGVGSNPEELLVSAVGACYSATLFSLLRRAELPARAVRIAAAGTVSDYPLRARFARLTVSPTILDGDPARHGEYEQTAAAAIERCFVGRTIGGNVDYELGSVTVTPAPAAAGSPAR